MSITRCSPNFVEQSFGDLERAAVGADVLAEAEDVLVALHLLEQRLANRLEIRDLSHRVSPAGRAPLVRALDRRLARPSRNQSGSLGRRIGVDADRARPCGSGIGDCSATSVAASISALHARVDRRQLRLRRRRARRAARARSGRADRSPSAHRSISPSGTYDWLSCSACPLRRYVISSMSVTPSPRRARSTARFVTSYVGEHVVAIGLLAGDAVADRLVHELLHGASASRSASSTRSRCSRR